MIVTKVPSPGLALLFAKLYEGPYDVVDPTEQGQLAIAATPGPPTTVVSLAVIPPILGGKAQGVLYNASPAAQIIRIGPLVGFAGTPCGVPIVPGAYYNFSDVGVALYGMADSGGALLDRSIMRTSIL